MTKKSSAIPTAGSACAREAGSTINHVSKTPPEAVLDGFCATAEGFMAAAQSAATKRAYAGDLRHFLNHGGALPATPVMLAEYLARCAEKLSVATLERRVTAIHKAHLEISAPSPALDAMVKRTLQGIRRTLGTKQRQPVLVRSRDLTDQTRSVVRDIERLLDQGTEALSGSLSRARTN